jgi:hypothetical protein
MMMAASVATVSAWLLHNLFSLKYFSVFSGKRFLAEAAGPTQVGSGDAARLLQAVAANISSIMTEPFKCTFLAVDGGDARRPRGLIEPCLWML